MDGLPDPEQTRPLAVRAGNGPTMCADADTGSRADERRGALVASIDETGPLIGGLLSQVPDIDPDETGEWVESLDGLIDEKGGPRARYVLLSMLDRKSVV